VGFQATLCNTILLQVLTPFSNKLLLFSTNKKTENYPIASISSNVMHLLFPVLFSLAILSTSFQKKEDAVFILLQFPRFHLQGESVWLDKYPNHLSISLGSGEVM